jgi:hypothetical protein
LQLEYIRGNDFYLSGGSHFIAADNRARDDGRARLIAEAQIDLMRVARARRDIISAAMVDPDYRPVTGFYGAD